MVGRRYFPRATPHTWKAGYPLGTLGLAACLLAWGGTAPLARASAPQGAIGEERYQPCFESGIELYDVPCRPGFVTSADFDGDGLPELVAVPTFFFEHPALLPNRGDGRYAPPIELPLDGQADRALTGDLDGDGDTDLGLTSFDDGLTILFNRGDGSFFDPVPIPGGDGARVAVDMDLDGDLDLVGTAGGSVALLRNRGTGSFEAPEVYPAFGEVLAAPDLTGDGYPDVALKGWLGARQISVLINQGDGSLGQATEYATFDRPVDLEAADVDGDGDVDLVSAEAQADDWAGYLPSEMGIYRNLGNGTFAAREALSIGPRVQAMTRGDFDGDGDVDFALLMRDSGVATFHWNDGRGGLETRTHFLTHRRWTEPDADATQHDVQAVDTDADGDLDLVLAYTSEREVGVLENLGGGRFASHERLIGWPASVLADVTDMNADGDLDLVVVNGRTFWHTGCKTLLYENDGSGRFGEPDELPGGFSAVAADLNGDGQMDLAVQSCALPVQVHFADSQGGFQAPLVLDDFVSSRLHAVDLDGDGDVDLAGRGSEASSISVWINPGDGMFPGHDDVSAGGTGSTVHVSDVDSDGDPDLVAPVGSLGRLALLVNRGNGTFRAPRILDAGAPFSSLILADTDGDGDPDLVIAHAEEGRLAIWPNHGGGLFAGPVDRFIGGYPAQLAAADLDGDGFVEILLSGVVHGQDGYWTLFNRGDGTFESPETYPWDRPLGVPSAADLDGDGRVELILSSHDAVTIVRSTCR